MVKLGEASLKAVVFHAMLEFASGVLVIAFYHLRVLLAKHCKNETIIYIFFAKFGPLLLSVVH